MTEAGPQTISRNRKHFLAAAVVGGYTAVSMAVPYATVCFAQAARMDINHGWALTTLTALAFVLPGVPVMNAIARRLRID
jgi:hypothetical protein